jgi:hypothetical protein
MTRIRKEFHSRFKSGPDSRSANEEKAQHTVHGPLSSEAEEIKPTRLKEDAKKINQG